MNDSLIIYGGLESATLSASGGSAAGYPTTNLQDRRFATRWKSGSTAQNQTLRSTESKAVDSVFLANHNLATLGMTALEVYDNVSGLIATVSVLDDPLLITFNENLSSYVELKFAKGSALSFAPEIGMLFIGKKSALPLYLNNPQRGLKIDLTRDESLSGLPYAIATGSERQTWKLDYAAMTRANNADAWRWLRNVKLGLYPFWFRDMDEHWHFGRVDANAMSGGGKGNVMFDLRNIQISEERVGISIELPGGYSV